MFVMSQISRGFSR